MVVNNEIAVKLDSNLTAQYGLSLEGEVRGDEQILRSFCDPEI